MPNNGCVVPQLEVENSDSRYCLLFNNRRLVRSSRAWTVPKFVPTSHLERLASAGDQEWETRINTGESHSMQTALSY